MTLMVRRRASAVSNHEAPILSAAILRDAAQAPLLRMRTSFAAQVAQAITTG
jgi:hypothetical protein